MSEKIHKISDGDNQLHFALKSQFEIIMDCLVYFSLKADFKTLLLDHFQSFKVLMHSMVSKKTLQPYIPSLTFTMLNIVRSSDFDIQVPSHTYTKHPALKDADVSYYDLKELSAQVHNKQLYASLNMDYINEYGERDTLGEKIIHAFVVEAEGIAVIKRIIDWMMYKQ